MTIRLEGERSIQLSYGALWAITSGFDHASSNEAKTLSLSIYKS